MRHYEDSIGTMSDMSALAPMDAPLPTRHIAPDDADARFTAKLDRQWQGVLDPIRTDLQNVVLSPSEMDAWTIAAERDAS